MLFDVSATRNHLAPPKKSSSRCTAAEARVILDCVFEGQAAFEADWGGVNPYTVFFAAGFDRPFSQAGGWQGAEAKPGLKAVRGGVCGLHAEFRDCGQPVGLHLGMSSLSLENARQNLAASKGQSFEQIRAAAVATWQNYLGRIRGEVERKRVTGDVPDYPFVGINGVRKAVVGLSLLQPWGLA